MIKDFSELPLKNCYDSGEDDILWDFYIPALSASNSYNRIAGFFSSSSLAIAAHGLGEFILNGGTMQLVTCPQLSADDVDMIQKSVKDLDSILSDSFINDYGKIEYAFERDHVKALGWMLANGKLKIKIAIIKKGGRYCTKEEIDSSGIMHQKVGIMYDSAGNCLTFSGSNNESSSGWLGNTEEFKVFTSWTPGLEDFIKADVKKFDSFWFGHRTDVEIKDLPKAVEEHLLRISRDFEVSNIALEKYKNIPGIYKEKEQLQLFPYQKIAVKKWNEYGRKLMLQMATGTGKTRTAIGCMKLALEDTQKLLIVIATPQPTLSAQWKTDIEKLDIDIPQSIEINGNINGWQAILQTAITQVSLGIYKSLVVYTTHDICHTEKFISVLSKNGKRLNKFLIADEVHGLGASKTKEALIQEYEFRLGLSATPDRWFDDIGTNFLREYFGNNLFEFSIKDALTNINPITGRTFLVNYDYYPYFVSLNSDEIEDYMKLTKKLSMMSRNSKEEIQKYIDYMRFQRANIGKRAKGKYDKLKIILDKIEDKIDDTIIFVDSEQIDSVMQILGERKIKAARFTQKQSAAPSAVYEGKSERQYLIDCFKTKKLQVLVAIKCLDEGIDIPSAKRAIIMASSTNPREYVQRIGRIIRQSTGKKAAEIYDMILLPDKQAFHDDKHIEIETKIFLKEMDRVLDISENALNSISVYNEMTRIRKEYAQWANIH